MSKGNAFENAYLLLLFNNTNAANIGDATGLRGSTVAGSLHLALHSADPGEAGTQATNELAYTGYARLAPARSAAGFTVTGNQVVLAANQDFGQRTDGGATVEATHFGIGTALSGAGVLLYRGIIGSQMGLFTAAVDDTLIIPGLTGLAVNDRVSALSLLGVTMPTGLVESTVYFVKTLTGVTITLSATQGGATLDITAVGAGILFRVAPISISQNVRPSLTTATTITEE